MGLAETLDVVVRKADELREKGVLEIECDGLRLKLAPAAAAAPVAVTTEDEDEPVNPLDDPDTFGGQLPTRRVAKEHSDDDR